MKWKVGHVNDRDLANNNAAFPYEETQRESLSELYLLCVSWSKSHLDCLCGARPSNYPTKLTLANLFP